MRLSRLAPVFVVLAACGAGSFGTAGETVRVSVSIESPFRP